MRKSCFTCLRSREMLASGHCSPSKSYRSFRSLNPQEKQLHMICLYFKVRFSSRQLGVLAFEPISEQRSVASGTWNISSFLTKSFKPGLDQLQTSRGTGAGLRTRGVDLVLGRELPHCFTGNLNSKHWKTTCFNIQIAFQSFFPKILSSNSSRHSSLAAMLKGRNEA